MAVKFLVNPSPLTYYFLPVFGGAYVQHSYLRRRKGHRCRAEDLSVLTGRLPSVRGLHRQTGAGGREKS